jgi:hypothetical protein
MEQQTLVKGLLGTKTRPFGDKRGNGAGQVTSATMHGIGFVFACRMSSRPGDQGREFVNSLNGGWKAFHTSNSYQAMHPKIVTTTPGTLSAVVLLLMADCLRLQDQGC